MKTTFKNKSYWVLLFFYSSITAPCFAAPLIEINTALIKNEVSIKVFQAKSSVNNKLVERRLRLLQYAASKTVPAFSLAGVLKPGNLLRFELEVKNPKLSYCLVGVDTKNTYHNYGKFANTAKNNSLEIPANGKALQLDFAGVEHFMILVSNNPLSDTFLNSLQGIEMTMSNKFYERVEKQIRSKLCKKITSNISGDFATAFFNFNDNNKVTDDYKKLMGDSIVAVVVDAEVKKGSANAVDSASFFYNSAKTCLAQKEYEKGLLSINKAINADPFNKDFYQLHLLFLASATQSGYNSLIKDDLEIITYLGGDANSEALRWYTDLNQNDLIVENTYTNKRKIEEVLKGAGIKNLYEYLETEPDAAKKTKLIYNLILKSSCKINEHLLNLLILADPAYKNDPFVVASYANLAVADRDSSKVSGFETKLNDILAKKQPLSLEATEAISSFYLALYYFYEDSNQIAAAKDFDIAYATAADGHKVSDEFFKIRTHLLVQKEEYTKALDLANSWVKAYPTSTNAYFTRALINLNLNYDGEAQHDAQFGYLFNKMGFIQ